MQNKKKCDYISARREHNSVVRDVVCIQKSEFEPHIFFPCSPKGMNVYH